MRLAWRLLAMIVLAGCTRLPEAPAPVQPGEKLPTQTIRKGKIQVVRGGVVQYIIDAGRIRSFEADKTTLLDSSVTVEFFNKSGRHTSTLTSHEARVDESKNLFVALGNVVVTTDSGSVLRTERLFWDETTNSVRSDTLVTMVTRYDSLRGYYFTANEDLTSWQLQRPTGETFRKIK